MYKYIFRHIDGGVIAVADFHLFTSVFAEFKDTINKDPVQHQMVARSIIDLEDLVQHRSG